MIKTLQTVPKKFSNIHLLSYYSFANNIPKVRVIRSHSNSIFWNLATEEFLFESSDLNHPTLFLYREDKTIIIGKKTE